MPFVRFFQEVSKKVFFHELGRRRSSGCETTAVLHGISTRIPWDQLWDQFCKKNLNLLLPVQATLGIYVLLFSILFPIIPLNPALLGWTFFLFFQEVSKISFLSRIGSPTELRMRNYRGFARNFDPNPMGPVLDHKTMQTNLNFYLTV